MTKKKKEPIYHVFTHAGYEIKILFEKSNYENVRKAMEVAEAARHAEGLGFFLTKIVDTDEGKILH